MAVDYDELGKRISNIRNRKALSQEELAEKTALSREYISRVESGRKGISIDSLVDIANILGCSTDDLLVDSLKHSVSTADSAIHRLLLDCNPLEEEPIILSTEIMIIRFVLFFMLLE